MQINARIEYALRAMLALAAAAPAALNGTALSEVQALPMHYLHSILSDLRRTKLVYSHRGTLGGYTLARPANEITVADVVEALDGTLLEVRGMPPSRIEYHGVATGLQAVWLAAEHAIHQVLREVTLADLVTHQLRADQPEHRSADRAALPSRRPIGPTGADYWTGRREQSGQPGAAAVGRESSGLPP